MRDLDHLQIGYYVTNHYVGIPIFILLYSLPTSCALQFLPHKKYPLSKE